MVKYVDLHIHTCISDGSDSMMEVLDLAKENSVSILSITDHNSLNAYSEKLFDKAVQLGIQIITGVELDVIFNNRQYHLLAYGIDLDNERLKEVCIYNSKVQEEYNLSLLRCIAKGDCNVSEEEYHRYEIPKGRGGWKLLNYLLDSGVTHTLTEGTKFYKKYGFNSNDIKFISLEEAIKVIHDASGISILAHPAEQINYNQYEDVNNEFWTTLNELMRTKVEGIECIHPLHGFELQKKLIRFCEQKGLFISGGTDYHGQFFNKQKQTIGGQLIKVDIVKNLITNI